MSVWSEVPYLVLKRNQALICNGEILASYHTHVEVQAHDGMVNFKDKSNKNINDALFIIQDYNIHYYVIITNYSNSSVTTSPPT